MKRLLIIPTLALAISGCALIDDKALEQQEIIKEELVTIPAVVEEVVLNGVTNLVETAPAQTITNLSTNIVWAVKPGVESSVEGLRGVNRLANPTPFAPLVDLALVGMTSGLAWYARKKNKEAVTHKQLFETVAKGVQKSGDPVVKKVIREVSELVGTAEVLHQSVQKMFPSKA